MNSSDLAARGFFSYENKLVMLLSVTFGLVIFDRAALSFLVPFLDKDLHVNNTQVGLLTSMLALGWAVSGYVLGALSDKTGKRKKYLIAAVAIFSICSFMSGLAESFAFLLIARIIMGLAEGPVLPLAQSILIDASTKKRKGFNMGFMQSFGGGVVMMVAPIVLVTLAADLGWRNAFFITGLPGALVAILILFVVKENKNTGRTIEKTYRLSVGSVLKHRNVSLTVLLSCFMMTWLFAQVTFLPKYLIAIKGLTAQDMGVAMGAFGLGTVLWGVLAPALSDRLGRKPIVVVLFLLGLLMPFGVLYFGNDLVFLCAFIIVGSSVSGCFPIVLATIPSETMSRQYVAQTIGLVGGIGELAGGFLAPATTGWFADRFGLQAPFFIAAGVALMAGLLACLLHETAPAILIKRDNVLKVT
jgi:MFS family permease